MYLKDPLLLTADDVMMCARDSQDRNRALNIEALERDLDPDGFSLIILKMHHNNVEWRTQMMLKVRGSMEPAQVFCDISFELMERIEAKQARIKLFLGMMNGMEEDEGPEIHDGDSGSAEDRTEERSSE